jgi:hypothetical protein
MNEFENKTNAPEDAGIDELRGELQFLRMLLCGVLMLLIGLSICADYYLSKQISFSRTAMTRAQQVVESFPSAKAEDFLNKLKDYGKTHPDFAPVMTKYGPIFGTAAQPAGKK